jgi:isopropylmalate/homocitrate/citramalate synthase
VDTSVSVLKGTDNPPSVGEMLSMSLGADLVKKLVDMMYAPIRLACTIPSLFLFFQFHDTLGMRAANSMAALLAGVRRVDGPTASLGECPCPANATGNAAIEYILEYILYGSEDHSYFAPVNLEDLGAFGYRKSWGE